MRITIANSGNIYKRKALKVLGEKSGEDPQPNQLNFSTPQTYY